MVEERANCSHKRHPVRAWEVTAEEAGGQQTLKIRLQRHNGELLPQDLGHQNFTNNRPHLGRPYRHVPSHRRVLGPHSGPQHPNLPIWEHRLLLVTGGNIPLLRSSEPSIVRRLAQALPKQKTLR